MIRHFLSAQFLRFLAVGATAVFDPENTRMRG